jgi:hypothetical protein
MDGKGVVFGDKGRGKKKRGSSARKREEEQK